MQSHIVFFGQTNERDLEVPASMAMVTYRWRPHHYVGLRLPFDWDRWPV